MPLPLFDIPCPEGTPCWTFANRDGTIIHAHVTERAMGGLFDRYTRAKKVFVLSCHNRGPACPPPRR